MGIFSAIGAAYLEGRQIKAFLLLRFDWNDGGVAPKNFFFGEGKILVNGETWYGSGRLVSMSNIQNSFRGEAPESNFTISGVTEELVALTVSDADAVRGRKVEAFYAYFDVSSPGWVALGSPLLFWTNTMKTLQFGIKGTERQITVNCEGPFYLRRRAVHGSLSSIDQKARFPGDKGCDHMQSLVDVTIRWPVFS